ncbi:hypothetical protein Acr_13g0012370 [Actinidia rufa]|uniref:Uncharacterized protein n=1 Tax=Actinidia rufa TaxID=165716 RepID=A0A7J0FPG7_9ERIC|nr:hypothetical protein Acr_13g0012370 [Actinidia rufa]
MYRAYLFAMGEWHLYSWRLENHVRRSCRDIRTSKYGSVSRRCKRLNWGDCRLESILIIIGAVDERISQWAGILVEIDQAKYSTSPKGERKRHHFALDQPKSTLGEFRSIGGKLRSFGEVPCRILDLFYRGQEEFGDNCSVFQCGYEISELVSGGTRLGNQENIGDLGDKTVRATCLT